jgi:hypothetical protein
MGFTDNAGSGPERFCFPEKRNRNAGKEVSSG